MTEPSDIRLVGTGFVSRVWLQLRNRFKGSRVSKLLALCLSVHSMYVKYIQFTIKYRNELV